MPKTLYLRATAILLAATLLLALLFAWRADRRGRTQLATDLAAANQSLAQATARQRDRDAQLQKTLAALAAEQRNIKTPSQIIANLPNQIPLPQLVTLQRRSPHPTPPKPPCSSRPACGPEGSDSTPPPGTDERNASNCDGPAHPCPPSAPAAAILPIADLKPLYDFAIACRSCQAKLAAAQADLADERAKTAVLTRERNEAVRVAKGGSLLRRIARNAKWLAIGAAAGAIAAKAHP